MLAKHKKIYAYQKRQADGETLSTADIKEILAMLRLYEVFDEWPLTPVNCRRSWEWTPERHKDPRALTRGLFEDLGGVLKHAGLAEDGRKELPEEYAMTEDRDADLRALPGLWDHDRVGSRFKYAYQLGDGDVVLETGCGEVLGVKDQGSNLHVTFRYDRDALWPSDRIVEVL